MLTPRNVLCVFVATLSMAMAACQPASNMPVELSAKSLDSSAKPAGDAEVRIAQKARDAGETAAK